VGAEYGSLPFKEQIDFFRDKVNLPTKAWTDLWQGMHARAFVVAGATREALLSDLRGLVDDAIAKGTSLQEFRKGFRAAAAKHGWSYNGGEGWRAKTIYGTNLRTSYQAGRYKQMTAVAKTRPFWQYQHSESVRYPRPAHEGWNGLVLRWDDTWWDVHFPPNGWGCRCSVRTLSQRDLERLGKEGPDEAPKEEPRTVDIGTRGPVEVKDKGIDPGWDYNVGKTAWGQPVAQKVMEEWRAMKGDAWEVLSPGKPADYGRSERMPVDATTAKLVKKAATAEESRQQIETLLGHVPEKVFNLGGVVPVVVNAQVLADHLALSRTPFLPALIDALSDPYEVWGSFQRHKGTGRVVLRVRAMKVVRLDSTRSLLVVFDARNGALESWTAIPSKDLKYVEKQREGVLLYGR